MVEPLPALEKEGKGAAAIMKALSLLYHDVVPPGNLDSSGFPGEAAARYKLDLEDFNQHIAAIAKTNKFHARIKCGSGTRPNYLTFDDGGVSAMLIADIIERHDWRAFFFVTAKYIDTPGFLSKDQIRALRDRGHVIGSHSYSHPERMAHCTREELLSEWAQSVEILSGILNEPIESASVPGGFYSYAVARAAAQAGITKLFTSEPGMRMHAVEGCLVHGRYSFWRGMPACLAADIVAGKRLARLKQYSVWNAKKIVKALGGKYYVQFKAWWLARK